MSTSDEFYRRFTLPEERKNRFERSLEAFSSNRWFASTNVVKLEDHRPPGEMGQIITLLRQRRRDEHARAIDAILADARRRAGKAP